MMCSDSKDGILFCHHSAANFVSARSHRSDICGCILLLYMNETNLSIFKKHDVHAATETRPRGKGTGQMLKEFRRRRRDHVSVSGFESPVQKNKATDTTSTGCRV